MEYKTKSAFSIKRTSTGSWISSGRCVVTGDWNRIPRACKASTKDSMKCFTVKSHGCDKCTVMVTGVQSLPWCVNPGIWQELRATEIEAALMPPLCTHLVCLQ